MERPKRNLAKVLRRKAPLNERRLWVLLRDRRLDGLKVRRQVALGSFIVDFASLRHRLVVEADGPFHDLAQDRLRDASLAAQGFRVLRFSNVQIEAWPERVLDEVRSAAGLPRIYAGPLEHVGRHERRRDLRDASSDPAPRGHLLPQGEKGTWGAPAGVG